ncbi:MAG: tRNA pseudouridine(55) synthase TruB [Candidatus Zixiibacteriota bacterium]
MNGFLLIDKHEGISSAHVVNRVKRLLQVKKAGHSGTLDPLATGLLVVCIGKATRLAQFLSEASKSYEAQIMFGATSKTYDRDGDIVETADAPIPTAAEVDAVISRYVGDIEQTAPLYSALKHKGKPLYDYARKNIPVELKVRNVRIDSIRVTSYSYPILSITVRCSSGTYIRSLAHDIGQALGCGGYIHSLRRTSIGGLDVASSILMADLELVTKEYENNRSGLLTDERFVRSFGSIERVLNLPIIYVSAERANFIDRGAPIRAIDVVNMDMRIRPQDLVALRNADNRLLAVGRALYGSDTLRSMAGETVVEYVRVM